MSTGLAWSGGSLLSEPVLPGSIQVPPDGQPIVTLHDGPTLGGYPKIAWIDPRDLPRLVQRRSGQPVRFTLAASAGHQNAPSTGRRAGDGIGSPPGISGAIR